MDLRKKFGLLTLILSGGFFAVSAIAQDAQVVTAEPAPVVEVQAEALPQQQPQVVIIQESAPAPAPAEQTVITQPTTVVEDSPLVESKAEKLRRDRQQAEVETEQKIVEKLEEARLEDEQKRMKKLFGNKLEAEQEKPVEAAPVVVAPVVAPPVEEKKEEINTDELKAEIAESVKADLNAIKVEEKKPEGFKPRLVVGAGIGTIDYEVGGLESDFAGGVSLGYEFRERMQLEGAFNYSQHTAFEFTGPNSLSIQDFDQYNFSVGIRYSILPYFISPVVGALASYTHRTYSVPGTFESEVDSDALDAGFLVGVDVMLNKNMSVAFDYRRYMNIENRVNNNTVLNQINNYFGFENSDYDMVNLGLRIMF